MNEQQKHGDRVAGAVIFGKAKRADKIAALVALDDVAFKTAGDRLHYQGPALWNLHCAAARKREGAKS